MSNKVFYAYTPYPNEELKSYGFGERATVAARLNKETGKFEYGVAICSADDNFNKTIGKQMALVRLEEGFGSTNYNQYYEDIARFFEEESEFKNDGTERATIQFVNDLSKSVFMKMKKYKRRLGNVEK